jgi:hypothetical protein
MAIINIVGIGVFSWKFRKFLEEKNDFDLYKKY